MLYFIRCMTQSSSRKINLKKRMELSENNITCLENANLCCDLQNISVNLNLSIFITTFHKCL